MRLRRIEWVVVLAAIALIAAAGLCLLDADNTGPDLCVAFLAITIGLSLTVTLALAGRAVPALTPAYDLSPRDLAAPPPKA